MGWQATEHRDPRASKRGAAGLETRIAGYGVRCDGRARGSEPHSVASWAPSTRSPWVRSSSARRKPPFVVSVVQSAPVRLDGLHVAIASDFSAYVVVFGLVSFESRC
jgi:hypothetical protein